MKRLARFSLAAAALFAGGPFAFALINPNFTPVHLVGQSKQIVQLDVPEKLAGDRVELTVRKALRGQTEAKTVAIDLSHAATAEQKEGIRKLFAGAANGPAILFAGEFAEESGDAGAAGNARAFLHVDGKWIALRAAAGGAWDALVIDSHMEATWAGGTDMLVKATDYILTDENPAVPAIEGVDWGNNALIGKVEGKVSAARPVWLDPAQTPYLHVAGDAGDRLFHYDIDAEKFADVTDKLKLASKSAASAWADFNRDGKLDLASWDGKSLALHLQGNDGTFGAAPVAVKVALEAGCTALDVIDVGNGRRTGLVVSTTGRPAVLSFAADGSGEIAALPAPEAKLGAAAACLVADFDDDMIPDIIHPHAEGSLFYRGEGQGKFAPPRACAVRLGPGRASAFVGDFDMDGTFDVITCAEDRTRVWHNLGEAQFLDASERVGEMSYIAQPRGIGGMTGDVNNDGRQDVLLLYSNRQPQLFFNRGFRSFGHAHQLDLADRGLLPQSAQGQQAGCLGDFAGYGAQDMVLVLADGEVHAFYRDKEPAEPLYAAAHLDPAAAFAGPLKVTGGIEGRGLGAWNVAPGGPIGFFGRMEAGAIDLRWRFPGGKEQTKKVIVEDRPVPVTIKGGG
ncbi:MAG: VCBS repeat-containing protein [Planctomycetales bacterium]